ncbi:MAG: Transcription termination factor NusA [Candidatus Daviesbacteria bacterium GW2011_GWA2_38_24]|uniref:Transcription termination/antitermination protein NusA n=1 Tax=Candidatus Daviesbacteria bacterium GW2011_GWA2_38_24 TaxID=1618422 RepID=A0A0G0MRC5_9BACT|nr:MAG: Transcription termination factor NusA [Candidatus Daviesbacteria bacterium GW2011_GWA2_38_24]KKQ78993.1 MAG: Transcription termination factor NusA [Candidatus Daviesbacteria bacterium GW2011_GWA1_38_7]OGE22829.1 MAG: transcription termination factor NusA [Candidatus Daviesbacteria bacterium RIFCSPHIGHO2_01_FULL_38_8]
MPIQARTEFAAALNQIASEKGVDVSVVIEAIEQAALAAYRKDLSLRGEPIPEDFEELQARINPVTGEITIYRGGENITPPGFARIAAQTAKQVITQRLHEAEKGAILDEFSQKVGTVVSGTIQRQEGSTYFVDLGRAEGVLPPSEQVRNEVYLQNQRLKFFIKEIKEDGRGPNVVLSRADQGLILGLFAMEVPEIQAGTVEIKAMAREAGGRTKVAAISSQDGIDPVGSLVGQKGVRVQAVINEIGEEKIDIVPYSDDPARFIAAALSPAKDVIVTLNEDEHTATVKVSDNQLSLAIGKGGQNVRLAAKLTGWKIDIEGIEGSKGEIKTEDADKVIEKTVGEDIEEAEVVESGELQQEPSQEEAETARADAEKDMAEELASAEGSAVETEVQEVEEKSEEDQKDK